MTSCHCMSPVCGSGCQCMCQHECARVSILACVCQPVPDCPCVCRPVLGVSECVSVSAPEAARQMQWPDPCPLCTPTYDSCQRPRRRP
jgi:hypothetical protein